MDKRRIYTYVACGIFLAGCTRSPGDLARNYGFLEHVPATNSHGPGDIVRADSYDWIGRKIQLGYACDPRQEAAAKRLVSVGANLQSSQKSDTKVQLTGPELQQFNLGADADFVRSVEMSFVNVQVIEISDETRLQVLAALPASCKNAINNDLATRFRVFQVSEVLKGDLVYKVNYETKANANAKAVINQKIKLSVGANVDVQGEDQIVGTGLFFGVRVRPIPAAL